MAAEFSIQFLIKHSTKETGVFLLFLTIGAFKGFPKIGNEYSNLVCLIENIFPLLFSKQF